MPEQVCPAFLEALLHYNGDNSSPYGNGSITSQRSIDWLKRNHLAAIRKDGSGKLTTRGRKLRKRLLDVLSERECQFWTFTIELTVDQDEYDDVGSREDAKSLVEDMMSGEASWPIDTVIK